MRGVVVDTAHFKGNFPESCSLEAAEGEDGPWLEILTRSPLRGDAENLFGIESDRRFRDMLRNLELVSMMLDRDARISVQEANPNEIVSHLGSDRDFGRAPAPRGKPFTAGEQP